MPITLVDQNDTPTPFNITLIDNCLPYDTHNTYSITIDTTFTIQTLLTCSPTHVDTWLLETQSLSPAIIGLDIEWRPNSQRGQDNPAATLQLCTNNRCLIFHLIHSPSIPTSLFTFLSNSNNRFVGVGIESDVEKLIEDYNLTVANYVDLRNLAAEVLEDRDLLKSGIKKLAERVLGKIVEKPPWITRSRWDNPWLDWDQVQYATVDAFLSFEIARRLHSHQFQVKIMAEAKPGLRKPTFTKVEHLQPGSSGHTLTVKVVNTKMVMQKGRPVGPQPRQLRIAESLVGDETGMIIFTARNDQVDLLKDGSTIILRNAKIDMFKGSMRLAVDKWGRVEVTDRTDFTVKEDNNLSLVEYELVNVVA